MKGILADMFKDMEVTENYMFSLAENKEKMEKDILIIASFLMKGPQGGNMVVIRGGLHTFWEIKVGHDTEETFNNFINEAKKQGWSELEELDPEKQKVVKEVVRFHLMEQTMKIVTEHIAHMKLKEVMNEPKEAKCLDNSGMEDLFDIGMTYILKGDGDENPIVVEDKYGNEMTVFRDRFEILENGFVNCSK